MRGLSRRGGGGVDLNIISRRGEVKVNFHLVRGGCDLILSHIIPIIAQSLKLRRDE